MTVNLYFNKNIINQKMKIKMGDIVTKISSLAQLEGSAVTLHNNNTCAWKEDKILLAGK